MYDVCIDNFTRTRRMKTNKICSPLDEKPIPNTTLGLTNASGL